MNRICEIFDIEHPIIQGGMVWCSGHKLASAVSNAGGLGLLGAGSMTVDVLREHIKKCKEETSKPFGVNVPLMYPQIEELMQIVVEEGVKVVFTSAGNPKTWTDFLHKNGVKVAHVVSSATFAKKAEDAGVDAVVAEGFEAGGHNGREETSTLCLIPSVRRSTSLPLVAAGGISSGESILAAQSLGAEGVQIGSLFAICKESSASSEFKELCTRLKEGDTLLCLKKLSPTRLVKNQFGNRLLEAEAAGASKEELLEMIGSGASKRGIFLGDLEEGELEIGQISSMIDKIESVEEIFSRLKKEYREAHARLGGSPLF